MEIERNENAKIEINEHMMSSWKFQTTYLKLASR